MCHSRGTLHAHTHTRVALLLHLTLRASSIYARAHARAVRHASLRSSVLRALLVEHHLLLLGDMRALALSMRLLLLEVGLLLRCELLGGPIGIRRLWRERVVGRVHG